MDKAHPLSSAMVVHSLDAKNDSFRPCEKCEELFDPEVPCLSAISALYILLTLLAQILIYLSIY